MKTYYYSAALVAGGLVYALINPQGSSSDAGRKASSDNGQSTSAAAESGATADKPDVGTTPDDLRSKFLEAQPPGQIRDDIDEPRFILATVPDPITTHLTVEFDRALDGIKDAAADEHYLLQRYWLPWPSGASQEKEDVERAKKLRHPGLLLFHNADRHSSLIVLLVGESPTNGIQRQQFDHALYLKSLVESLYHERHPESGLFDKRLYILGTSFSGSLRTLRLALGSYDFEAVSGTVSDEKSINEFNAPFGNELRLETLVHGSRAALKTFLNYLKREWHYQGKTAILSETDTVFGALDDIEKDDKEVFVIPFPRDIAHLRNAYQSHPELSQIGAGNADARQLKNLPLGLDDQLNTTDSIPDFAAQTVVSQETMALQISNRIRHEDIHFAGIVGSSILDVLFVARFLREANPNLRLFVLNPDLLFVHAADALPFEGILAVTTYPLLDGNPPFSRSSPAEKHWMFSAPFQQGIHNVMRVLLHDIGQGELLLPGFRRLNPGDDEPALWITSVGRESFVPIAALQMKSSEHPERALAHVSGRIERAERDHAQNEGGEVLSEKAIHHPTRLWWILLGVSTAAMGGIRQVIRRAQESRANWLIDYCLRKATPGRALHLSLLLIFAVGGHLVLTSTGLALLRRPEPWSALLFSILLATGFGLIGWLVRLWFAESGIVSKNRINTPAVVCAAVGVLLIFSLFVFLSWQKEDLRGIFFAFRSSELSAGASPTVPFFFVLAGFAVWSFGNLQREIFHQERRRFLPRPDCDAILGRNMAHAGHRLVRHFHRPFKTSRGPSSLLAFFAFIGCFYWLWVSLRSFEGIFYDCVFVVCASALSAALVVAASHFLRCWLLLTPILDQLEMHALRRGIAALPPDESWSPIWQSNPRERNYLILSRSLETLAALPAELTPT